MVAPGTCQISVEQWGPHGGKLRYVRGYHEGEVELICGKHRKQLRRPARNKHTADYEAER